MDSPAYSLFLYLASNPDQIGDSLVWAALLRRWEHNRLDLRQVADALQGSRNLVERV
jgi:hypothetical protein